MVPGRLMARLMDRGADMPARCAEGMARAGTYSKMMKPYSAKSENHQGYPAADQAR